MVYCIAAASSPLAPPNCSRRRLPNFASGVPILTVYMSFLMWWYIEPQIALGFRRALSGDGLQAGSSYIRCDAHSSQQYEIPYKAPYVGQETRPLCSVSFESV